MKIESSSIQLSSQRSIVERKSVRESIRVWVGDGRPDPEKQESPSPAARSAVRDVLALSNKARTSRLMEKISSDEDEDDFASTPELRMLKLLIERLLGRKIKLSSPKATQDDEENVEKHKPVQAAEPRQGFGIEYDYHESHYESEKTDFSARGVINTTDGKKISFNLNLNLSREFMRERNISVRAGDAKLKDPLVINFNGTSAQLTSTKFSFDIDSDGKADQISFVGANSGFLAIDRNNDNKINDGSELFGPKTGNGFRELAKYDSDHNNWIDESDPIYSKLRIWSRDYRGNDILAGLEQKGIGAIYLGYQNTQFELNDKRNEMQGQLRASGIYVNENGSVGTIQQLDLVT